ncbi:MAG: pyridoxal-phosphate dependent enzyme [Gemmatimonadota bacterium]|nr:pyridoxal-phosphate dependent enzyme [Gemmatimonadota bacterium]
MITPRPTTIVDALRLKNHLGLDITLASETLQYTGSFKFRAAYNVARSVPNDHIICASSGNFGQAIAYASSLFKKKCTVVMPDKAPSIKVDAVREYGAEVDLVDVKKISRLDRLAELSKKLPNAYVASPYDDPLVIDGNATLFDELTALGFDFDYIIAPIGGGGLVSGLVQGAQKAGKKTGIIAAEPLLSNDFADSIRAGKLLGDPDESTTMADGARMMKVGENNWRILQKGIAGVIEVSEEQIAEGVRMLFLLANLKAEPTGALSIGAILADPDRFKGKRTCCVISGANADPALYASLIAAKSS